MLQEQTDWIMTKENSDGDDYADWIKWSSDAEENRLSVCESARNVFGPVLLQQHKPNRDSVIPMILQTTQARTAEPDHKPNEGCASCNHPKSEIRWKEICERIKVDANLDKRGQQQLWQSLRNTRTSLLGTRANWAIAPSVSITLIRRDSRLIMHLLDDCLTGRRLKSRGRLMFWLT